MKIHVSYRLSEEAVRLLKLLAEDKGISLASTLEIAIREVAKKEQIVPSQQSTEQRDANTPNVP